MKEAAFIYNIDRCIETSWNKFCTIKGGAGPLWYYSSVSHVKCAAKYMRLYGKAMESAKVLF